MVRPKWMMDWLLLTLAKGVVALQDGVVRRVVAAVTRVNQAWPLRPLRSWLARQPPSRALPLFLVPELTSRSGTAVSAVLLVQGRARQAITVYLLSKLFAGLVALWVYSACQPALLRIAWFARLHRGATSLRTALTAWLRRGRPGPFAAAVARVRSRNAAATQVPAIPSAPVGRGRTG